MITSPYNFVPLSDKVVMPFWAKHISHDIPFENGLSGVLNLKIKAESPIYVRNGVFRKDVEKENKQEINSFNYFENKQFIPATSIKGMLRSVMEIMSFGRMANKVDDNRYSVRDFQNTNIYNIAELSTTVSCGWLKKENGEYYLQDCGEPGRISHEKIDAKFNTNMSSFFQDKDNVRPNSKSAWFKYDKFHTVKGTRLFTGEKVVLRYICDFDENGREGTIVFTGQPTHRFMKNGKWEGKHLEFVFFKNSNSFEKVDDKVIKNLFFAYFDHDKTQQKDDWKKLRKPKLEGGKEAIPVFFRKNADGTIKDMGLSFLYKITYNNSIKEVIDKKQTDAESYDLAETIFGYTEKETALKGRVHISHAFLTNGVPSLLQTSAVLSGPKASYYPNYVKQTAPNGNVRQYLTFMDSTSEIRGWKRYPIRSNGVVPNINNQNDRVTTSFIPLNEGAEFELAIRYHNLREEELGALISAITFHNTEGVYHSIGMAKPLGYGKVTLSIDLEENKKLQYLKAYEAFMDYGLENSTPLWFQSLQIKELFAMAKGSPNDAVDKQLAYMSLEGFANEKGARGNSKSALQSFSIIANNAVYVTSLTSAADIVKAKAKFEKEEMFFSAAADKKSLEQQTKLKYETALKTAFEEKKNQLLALLEAKRQEQKQKEDAITEKERLKKRDGKNTEAEQTRLAANSLDYEKAVDVYKSHLKKYNIKAFATHQKEQLKNDLTASFESTASNKKSTWAKKNNKFTEFPWTDIRKWLGEDEAKTLHSELENMKL